MRGTRLEASMEMRARLASKLNAWLAEDRDARAKRPTRSDARGSSIIRWT